MCRAVFGAGEPRERMKAAVSAAPSEDAWLALVLQELSPLPDSGVILGEQQPLVPAADFQLFSGRRAHKTHHQPRLAEK